jgi:putative ABC transport system permease protein
LEEALLLSVVGFIIGGVLGIAGVYGITSAPIMQSFMDFTINANAFLIAVIVAVLLALAGGLYPAYRASRLAPTEALRYE